MVLNRSDTPMLLAGPVPGKSLPLEGKGDCEAVDEVYGYR